MSQHDFDITNQTAPNTRVDINLALKALASTSSGASAPLTTFANMIYYNTSTKTLYKRNEADSNPWIALGTVDESLGTFTPSGFVLASQAEAEAGTENTKVMTPLRVSQAIEENDDLKAWVNFNGVGTVAIRASKNVASVVRLSTGRYRVTFTTPMVDTNYAVVCSGHGSSFAMQSIVHADYDKYTTGYVDISTGNSINAAYEEMQSVNVAIYR